MLINRKLKAISAALGLSLAVTGGTVALGMSPQDLDGGAAWRLTAVGAMRSRTAARRMAVTAFTPSRSSAQAMKPKGAARLAANLRAAMD